MAYLQEDIPALERAFKASFERVMEETDDPDWNFNNHPALPFLERFDPSFGVWVNRLIELGLLVQAGYPLAKNDIPPVEWKCLALVNQWRQNRVGKK